MIEIHEGIMNIINCTGIQLCTLRMRNKLGPFMHACMYTQMHCAHMHSAAVLYDVHRKIVEDMVSMML